MQCATYTSENTDKMYTSIMWANAQRDGRPAEYAVQRHKVWLTPSPRLPCSNDAKTRKLLKFAGVPQT